LPEQFDFIKQSSGWQRLFYIMEIIGTNKPNAEVPENRVF